MTAIYTGPGKDVFEMRKSVDITGTNMLKIFQSKIQLQNYNHYFVAPAAGEDLPPSEGPVTGRCCRDSQSHMIKGLRFVRDQL